MSREKSLLYYTNELLIKFPQYRSNIEYEDIPAIVFSITVGRYTEKEKSCVTVALHGKGQK